MSRFTTRERAEHLVRASTQFPYLGLLHTAQLLEVVRLELGHREILDDFQLYGGHRARAIPVPTILHIVSGNTPHAALQSLLRGLLLGARNLCKIPSLGLNAPQQLRAALPDEMAAQLEISTTLPDEWLARADAVVVFGGDETIAHFRERVPRDRVFLPHGHKVSIGLVFQDTEYVSAQHAARDASLFDQQGCLSPHVFYVQQDAAQFATHLAAEMERFQVIMPRAPISAQEAASIRALRQSYAFRAAAGEPVNIWTSRDGTAWTVICETETAFVTSPLNRAIFVKPMPAEPFRIPHLSTVGIWPATLPNARTAAAFGATRVCRLGTMQEPPWTWHQDGGQTLAPLVRWIDFSH